jgi:hypothetical protein
MNPSEADAAEFWQQVPDTGYIIEGENRQTERQFLHSLVLGLDEWPTAHPEVKIDSGKLDHFAMHAVKRLAAAFIFNDSIAADVVRPFSTLAGDGVGFVVGSADLDDPPF